MNTEVNEVTGLTVEDSSSIDFQDYDAKAVPAIPTGQRICKCQYKEDKKEGKRRDSAFIFLPELSEPDSDWLVTFMPHLIGLLEDTQDKLIKAIHISGATTVQRADIDLSAILESLEATGEGRLNKEKVFSWFDTDVKDLLIVAFADKLGISDEPSEEETKLLTNNIEIYRTRFGALAGANSSFVPEECDKLIKALSVTGADNSALGVRFTTRLEKMKSDQLNLLPDLL